MWRHSLSILSLLWLLSLMSSHLFVSARGPWGLQSRIKSLQAESFRGGHSIVQKSTIQPKLVAVARRRTQKDNKELIVHFFCVEARDSSANYTCLEDVQRDTTWYRTVQVENASDSTLEALWTSTSLLSHSLIVLIRDMRLPFQAIRRGLHHRQAKGMAPSKILFLPSNKKYELPPGDLSSSIAIANLTEASMLLSLKTTQEENNGDEVLASLLPNPTHFEQLFRQVYQSMHAGDENVGSDFIWNKESFNLSLSIEAQRQRDDLPTMEYTHTTSSREDLPHRSSKKYHGTATVLQDLHNLQQQLEEKCINDPHGPPGDFGNLCNSILKRWSGGGVDTDAVIYLVKQMHQTHVQYLRDYYSKLFEKTLETPVQSIEVVTQRTVQSFCAAAQQSIPNVAQGSHGPLSGILKLDYRVALNGLMGDLEQLTALLQDDLEEATVLNGTAPLWRLRLKKWGRIVGSRVLTVGFNYLQGWLAWQGVRRAALERERRLPKFPLF